MANGCTMKSSTFFAQGERQVICPRPRRLHPSAAVRPFRLNAVFPAETSDLKPVNDLLDFLLPKQCDSTPPFFCGSPPSRSNNPVVHDARFGEAALAGPIPVPPPPIGYGSASSSSRSACARVRYGFSPAPVRVEGFDCLDRETSQSRGVPAFA
ncbi:hypothetical protein KSP40_PGU022389 [Platanthera guangdongensis]|uniref:Uncharacterized protein n=1 Tax=Platanthera guangdongensis TaxID=2320717 RepID=A0ABR2M4V0_9ASPA